MGSRREFFRNEINKKNLGQSNPPPIKNMVKGKLLIFLDFNSAFLKIKIYKKIHLFFVWCRSPCLYIYGGLQEVGVDEYWEKTSGAISIIICKN